MSVNPRATRPDYADVIGVADGPDVYLNDMMNKFVDDLMIAVTSSSEGGDIEICMGDRISGDGQIIMGSRV